MEPLVPSRWGKREDPFRPVVRPRVTLSEALANVGQHARLSRLEREVGVLN
jgi:hypothetical protein